MYVVIHIHKPKEQKTLKNNRAKVIFLNIRAKRMRFIRIF